jgi:hypothetical protein
MAKIISCRSTNLKTPYILDGGSMTPEHCAPCVSRPWSDIQSILGTRHLPTDQETLPRRAAGEEIVSRRRRIPPLRPSSSLIGMRARAKARGALGGGRLPLVSRAQRRRMFDDDGRRPVAGLVGDRRGVAPGEIWGGGLGRWSCGASCVAALTRVATAG